MAHERRLDFEGTVVEVLHGSTFRVRLDNDAVVLAYAAGKTRKSLMNAVVGHRVFVQLGADAADRGRIIR